MTYPEPLKKSTFLGVFGPSAGVVGVEPSKQLTKSYRNVGRLGFRIRELNSARACKQLVGATAKVRSDELNYLFQSDEVSGIMTPWSGDLAMDMLPLVDFEKLGRFGATWICGNGDVTALLLAITLICDYATIHGTDMMSLGYGKIHEFDLKVFEAMTKSELIQSSSPVRGNPVKWSESEASPYELDQPSAWKMMQTGVSANFNGRMIGGCLEAIRDLIGTPYAPVPKFIEKYAHDGIIWVLDSDSMSAPEVYKALWQMREAGWFKSVTGFLLGRSSKCASKNDFHFIDALEQALGKLNAPVIYDADIGRVPPRIQIVNGALGRVEFSNGIAMVRQWYR
ncbi:MAG: LD-carboxypeptidase [Clostridiales bacterium]|jgi:muramoyltetrapeptide carboxypeptidase LdcA involved in peptidoglycan recycling|nr:LD-carboxypeptidase [Clostridiales bacterium]MDR2749515.1 LD-carboxypeptidase [Clostridiales bacterium]